ncbi:MAG: CARDB domain-containing protein, partial [Bacteroidota bacterium]
MSLALRFLLCFTFLNALVFSTSAKPMVADDIGIAEILRPAPSECGNNVLVEVRVQNYGDNSVTSFFISYTVDGTLVANYLSVDSLGPGQSIEVAFPALTLADGNHSLEVETSLPNGNNDGDTGNDKKVKSFSILISQGLTAPYFESFESGTWPPTDWILQNPDNSVGWQETSLASVTGNTSIYMDNFNYNAIGQVDEFQTAGFDLTGETKIALSFYLAYAPFGDNTGFADTLEIWVSGNCGLNYDRVYKAWGQDLATAPATTSMFVPASWMWKKVWVDISDYAGSTYFVANFRHTTN